MLEKIDSDDFCYMLALHADLYILLGHLHMI
jgi:hypothetical protein